MSANNPHEPIVVTHDGGLRFVAQVRSHSVIVDQPIHVGGSDAAPMPIEMMGVSLGTCIALYVHQFCQLRGIPTEGMRVEVDQVSARHPSRVSEFVVRVLLPQALPPAYSELLERVVHSCPAHNTLERGAALRVLIETPAPVS